MGHNISRRKNLNAFKKKGSFKCLKPHAKVEKKESGGKGLREGGGASVIQPEKVE